MSDKSRDYQRPRAPPVIDAWDAPAAQENAPCLFANGFTIVEGDPPAVEHPYLVLGFPISLAQLGEHYEIALHLTHDSSRYALHHPETTASHETLVDVLARHLASARLTLDIHEARIGEQPLPIYIVDLTWKPVAERFVAEYGRPATETVYSK